MCSPIAYVTDQVHNAGLQGRGRKCRSEGLRNALETIGDGDQDVADSAGLQVVIKDSRIILPAPPRRLFPAC